MPAPARTSRDAIVEAARALLEEEGLDARRHGRGRRTRRGPRPIAVQARRRSLGAHPRGRGMWSTADLHAILDRAMSTGDPAADLRALANAYRAFVRANPNGYGLLFAHLEPDLQPEPGAVGGPRPTDRGRRRAAHGEHGPGRARGGPHLVAWAHGFVSMELAGGSGSAATWMRPTRPGST